MGSPRQDLGAGELVPADAESLDLAAEPLLAPGNLLLREIRAKSGLDVDQRRLDLHNMDEVHLGTGGPGHCETRAHDLVALVLEGGADQDGVERAVGRWQQEVHGGSPFELNVPGFTDACAPCSGRNRWAERFRTTYPAGWGTASERTCVTVIPGRLPHRGVGGDRVSP